jgi:hypothetical protein
MQKLATRPAKGVAHSIVSTLTKVERVQGRHRAFREIGRYMRLHLMSIYVMSEDAEEACRLRDAADEIAAGLDAVAAFEDVLAATIGFFRGAGREDHGSRDLLGEVSAEGGWLDGRQGQFFTPSSVSDLLMEFSSVGIHQAITRKGWAGILEPTAGTGALVLSADRIIRRRIRDAAEENVVYVANEINRSLADICWVQLALSEIPAIVICSDANELATRQDLWRRGTPSLGRFYSAHGTETTAEFVPDLVLANPPF